MGGSVGIGSGTQQCSQTLEDFFGQGAAGEDAEIGEGTAAIAER